LALSKAVLPPGVLSLHVLPADHHDRDWDNIVVPREVKERLLNQALLTLLHGRRLSMLAGLPHGLIVLSGPSGTGKTTLGRGLAQVAALALAARGATTLVEINPHAFPSDMLGESQRNITRLMQDTIPEIAARRPHTVVLIDEVEAFAVRRTTASFETNPVDVHRATDAILLGIDEIARSLPNVLFVTTTNFIEAVDDAFLSRADLVLHFELPDVDTIGRIITHSLVELGAQWPALMPLAGQSQDIADLAASCEGWNGRRVRKLLLAGLAQRTAVAKDPGQLTFEDLQAAARKQGGVEWVGGAAPPAHELFPESRAGKRYDDESEHGHAHSASTGRAHAPSHLHDGPEQSPVPLASGTVEET
jgi:SpoVK/Ycf46/Vps4 family AAA+-type ATPase